MRHVATVSPPKNWGSRRQRRPHFPARMSSCGHTTKLRNIDRATAYRVYHCRNRIGVGVQWKKASLDQLRQLSCQKCAISSSLPASHIARCSEDRFRITDLGGDRQHPVGSREYLAEHETGRIAAHCSLRKSGDPLHVHSPLQSEDHGSQVYPANNSMLTANFAR